jgi:hypothetical protein
VRYLINILPAIWGVDCGLWMCVRVRELDVEVELFEVELVEGKKPGVDGVGAGRCLDVPWRQNQAVKEG